MTSSINEMINQYERDEELTIIQQKIAELLGQGLLDKKQIEIALKRVHDDLKATVKYLIKIDEIPTPPKQESSMDEILEGFQGIQGERRLEILSTNVSLMVEIEKYLEKYEVVLTKIRKLQIKATRDPETEEQIAKIFEDIQKEKKRIRENEQLKTDHNVSQIWLDLETEQNTLLNNALITREQDMPIPDNELSFGELSAEEEKVIMEREKFLSPLPELIDEYKPVLSRKEERRQRRQNNGYHNRSNSPKGKKELFNKRRYGTKEGFGEETLSPKKVQKALVRKRANNLDDNEPNDTPQKRYGEVLPNGKIPVIQNLNNSK